MRMNVIAVFLAVLAPILLCTLTLLTAASAAWITANVSLDGNILELQARVCTPSVYLPVRPVCEALGYDVVWADGGGVRTVTVSKARGMVALDLTNQNILYNGHLFSAGVYSGKGIDIISGRTYIDAGLFSSIFTVRSSYDEANNQVTLRRRCENNITITTEMLHSEIDLLKTTIQYPQLSGLTDDNVRQSVNAVLKQSAQNALDEGRRNAEDMAQAIKDGYTGAVGMCETYYDYIIGYNQNGLFSVVLTDYQYAGGAHGGTVQRAYTFDLSTGKALQLCDLMESGSNYAKYINTAVRKEIDRRSLAGVLSEFDLDKFADIGTSPEFYLSHDAVVIYFQQYAYFPYAVGLQEFSVEFSELSSMFNKEFEFLYRTSITLDPQGIK